MDTYIIIFAACAVVLAVVIAVSFALKEKRRTDTVIRQNENDLGRQKRATWAKALVIHSQASTPPVPSNKVPIELTLEVTPPSGKPYRAKTQWSVDMSAMGYVAQGTEVSVKIDRDNNKIIYPNASWAKYIGY